MMKSYNFYKAVTLVKNSVNLSKVFYGSFLIILLTMSGCTRSQRYIRIEGYAQGGTYTIVYDPKSTLEEVGSNTHHSDSVTKLISKTLVNIDFSLSGYNKNSIVSKVNNNEPCTLDKYFIELFTLSKEISAQTEGYFDISGGPLYDFWGFGFKDPQAMSKIINDPGTPDIIDSLKTIVGMDKIRIENGALIKDDPRITLNFNAIAQGYTCDVLASLLDSLNIQNYLVEVGMEIVCKGVNASGTDWRIGIDTPKDGSMVAGESIEKIVPIKNGGIVTSGNYRKYHIVNGRKYAHSIDPHTGYPVQHDLLSATVISHSDTLPGAHADAYATYCMVVGKEKATEFISKHSNLKGYLITSSESINLLE